jgi:tetratricopeptide (TPR) repeat protein
MIAGPVEGEERAEELAAAAEESYRSLGDTWGEAAALNALGWLYVAQERFAGTGDVFERTLSASVAAGDEQFTAMAEVNLAEYLLHNGDVEGSAALLASCVERHRSLRLPYSVAYLLEAVARLAAEQGDARQAARLIGAASAMRSAAGLSVWGSQLERREQFINVVRTGLGETDYRESFDAGSRLSYSDALDAAVPAPGAER